VHFATTTDTTSAHVTLGLNRQGHTWLDVLNRHCELVGSSHAACVHLKEHFAIISQQPTGLSWRHLAGFPATAKPTALEVCHGFQQVARKAYPEAQLDARRVHNAKHAEVAQIMYHQSLRETTDVIEQLLDCTDGSLEAAIEPPEVLATSALERERRASSYTADCRDTCICSSCDCGGS
jgi:hypothetical protein